jgi:hypothetical protein
VTCPEHGTDSPPQVLEQVAQELIRRRLTAPAIFALESTRPLSFLASQALLVLGPLVQALLPLPRYQEFCEALEDRRNIDWLITRLERGGAHGDAAPTESDDEPR